MWVIEMRGYMNDMPAANEAQPPGGSALKTRTTRKYG
jgi:hypothetical protein